MMTCEGCQGSFEEETARALVRRCLGCCRDLCPNCFGGDCPSGYSSHYYWSPAREEIAARREAALAEARRLCDFPQWAPPRPMVKIALLRNAVMPAYATPGSAGLDLSATTTGSRVLRPHCITKVPTGVALQLPVDWMAEVRPRSGMSSKGIICVLGTVDSDYRGEIYATILNSTTDAYKIEPGDRIAQLVVVPAPQVQLVEVQFEQFTATKRGTNGYGSTGR